MTSPHDERSARTDPGAEAEAWFTQAFKRADYRTPESQYEHYQPAYHYGSHARSQHGSREWDDTLDAELQREWSNRRGNSPLDWERARPAVMEAYHAPTVGTAEDGTPEGSYSEGGSYGPDDSGPGGDRFKVG